VRNVRHVPIKRLNLLESSRFEPQPSWEKSMKSHMITLLTLTTLALAVTATTLAQQAGTAPTQQPATAALTPNPEWIHQKLGVFVYPAKGQKPAQQQKDETDCYNWSRSQTGIDPTAPATAAAPAPEKADNPGQGARAAGAAKGAAGGAVIGAVAGDAGKGAAIGATAGTMRGGAQKRKAKKAAEQEQKQQQEQAQQQATGADKQKMDTFKKAYSACVQGRGYTSQ
jgi:OmpA family protein